MHDRRIVNPVGVLPQRPADLSEESRKGIGAACGDVADGLDSDVSELLGGSFSDKKHFSRIERPKKLFVILARDFRGGIRFFVFRAHFGEDLIERNSGGKRQTEFFLYRLPDFIRNLSAASEKIKACGYIHP